MPAEFDFIRWLKTRPSTKAAIGIGDDLAALHWPTDDLLLVGVDQILDGVHFDSNVHSPADIGRKAMNRNLSDCAAMACLPVAAVCTLALPSGCGEEYARQLYLGMEAAGQKFDCAIVGGDTGSWPGKLVVTISILGRSAGIAPITRAGAKPGDYIYVTGPLGGSILGRHLSFEPRVHLARELASTGLITAMADISDGLSRDLKNICDASGAGALLNADRIPVHPDVSRLPSNATSPVDHALHDGEDYELVLTSRAALDLFGIFEIGRIVESDHLEISDGGNVKPVLPQGWQHSL